MSATEILWAFHTDNISSIRESSPSQMRKYLDSMKDYDALRVWDRMRLSDSHDQ